MMASAILAVRVGGQGDVKGKQVLWTQTKGIPEVPSLVLYRERLYAVKSGGVLTCRSQKTGQALFEERLQAGGGYFASPIAAGGRVYTSSDRGVITIIRASDKLEVLGQAELKEPILATPAIVEGKLYVRTEKHLFAFGE
jgi:outer membrane protein assembly factor BamB